METVSMYNQPEMFGWSEQHRQCNSRMFCDDAVSFGATYVVTLLYRRHLRVEHLDKELFSHLPTNPSSKDSKALQERM